MGVDYSEVEAFKAKLDNIAGDASARGDICAAAANELAARLLRRTKLKTPVKTGNLRRGWQASAAVGGKGSATAEVSNAVSYAPYVENGHRTTRGGWVSGRFMLKRSVDELRVQAPAIVARIVAAKMGI